MKKIFSIALIFALTFSMAIGLSACGGNDEKEYIDESEISKAINDPDSYKGKYIKVAGVVFDSEASGDVVAIQAWHDVKNSKEDFIAYAESEEKFDDGDIVVVDGKIEGKQSGENVFGGNVETVKIAADKMEKSTYEEAIAPAKETRETDKSQEQHKVTLTVQKVEFAESETRIYVEVKNDSKYDCTVYTNLAKVVQDGKQYDIEYNYEAHYPEIDDVAAGASKDGIILVKELDPEKDITITVDAYSDNYELDFKDYKLTF